MTDDWLIDAARSGMAPSPYDAPKASCPDAGTAQQVAAHPDADAPLAVDGCPDADALRSQQEAGHKAITDYYASLSGLPAWYQSWPILPAIE